MAPCRPSFASAARLNANKVAYVRSFVVDACEDVERA
jgi:hypothetical protein